MVDIPTDEFDRKFIEAFGCTKEEFAKMKPWKQAELSKLTKLILEPTAETVATAPPVAPPPIAPPPSVSIAPDAQKAADKLVPKKFIPLIDERCKSANLGPWDPVQGEPKLVRLLAQVWSEAMLKAAGADADDIEWDWAPGLLDKWKEWREKDFTTLIALLMAVDAADDLEAFGQIGMLTADEASVLCAEALEAACHARGLTLESGTLAACKAHLTAKWSADGVRGDALGEAKKRFCNTVAIEDEEQMKNEWLVGAIAFMTCGKGELPADLRAQDGLDGGRTALCKAALAADVGMVKRILSEDGTPEQLGLGSAGKSFSDAWARGMAVFGEPLCITPLFDVLSGEDKIDERVEILEALLAVDSSQKVFEGVGEMKSSLLVCAAASTALASTLLKHNSSEGFLGMANNCGNTIIHAVAMDGNAELASKVLALEACDTELIRKVDLGGSSALMVAATWGMNEVGKLLVAADPSVEHLTLEGCGRSTVEWADGDLKEAIEAALQAS